MAGFAIPRMILTSCQTPSVQHCAAVPQSQTAAPAAQTTSAPVAWRPPLLHGYRMFHRGVMMPVPGKVGNEPRPAGLTAVEHGVWAHLGSPLFRRRRGKVCGRGDL